jgi:inorganic pyrophosphatase
LEKLILSLEEKLLDNSIRMNPIVVSELVSPDFIEYCSSGEIYRYRDGDVFSNNPDDLIEYYISNFTVKQISNDCILANYSIRKKKTDANLSVTSNRSSIWKNHDGKWKIIFHQGTISSVQLLGDNKKYWDALADLVNEHEIVIDRPKGSAHPKYPDVIYKVDYGYLDGTTTIDGGGIDIFVGEMSMNKIQGIMCTVDTLKNDTEIKIIYNCNSIEIKAIYNFLNSGYMKAIFIGNTNE